MMSIIKGDRMGRWAYCAVRVNGARQVKSCGFVNGRSRDEAEGAGLRESRKSLEHEGKGADEWPVAFIFAWQDK